LLDPKGTTPEWGYVTDITNAATGTLGVSGGFSSGGTAASRYYTIVDKSASTGAQVVKIDYLTSAYAEKTILVCMNGTTDRSIQDSSGNNLTETFRVNSFRVVAAGSANAAAGNLSLRATGDTPVYSYITAGFTRARNSAYTVPAGKSLYIYQILFSYGHASDQTHYARLYTRANIEPSTRFNTGSIFYPFSESVLSNSSQIVPIDGPTYLPAKTDIKISGIATVSGHATGVLRGWLETA
jgi:peptide methionine sulfoxide reductase MsrA